MKPRNELSPEAAESVAIQALTFIASEPARMERFLASSGMDGAMIRTAATQPGFLAGLLDYLSEDEALLVAFAEASDLHPLDVESARKALNGPRWHRDFA